MKFSPLTIFILVLIISSFAVFSYASFTKPATAPTGTNAYGYIDVGGVPGGADPGIKNGGLSVNAFKVNNNALFKDQVFFDNPIQALSADAGTLNFGDATHAVSVDVNRNVTGSSLQSDTVKSGGGLKYLCGGSDGTMVICGQ